LVWVEPIADVPMHSHLFRQFIVAANAQLEFSGRGRIDPKVDRVDEPTGTTFHFVVRSHDLEPRFRRMLDRMFDHVMLGHDQSPFRRLRTVPALLAVRTDAELGAVHSEESGDRRLSRRFCDVSSDVAGVIVNIHPALRGRSYLRLAHDLISTVKAFASEGGMIRQPLGKNGGGIIVAATAQDVAFGRPLHAGVDRSALARLEAIAGRLAVEGMHAGRDRIATIINRRGALSVSESTCRLTLTPVVDAHIQVSLGGAVTRDVAGGRTLHIVGETRTVMHRKSRIADLRKESILRCTIMAGADRGALLSID
jgi:hypothetical protein